MKLNVLKFDFNDIISSKKKIVLEKSTSERKYYEHESIFNL